MSAIARELLSKTAEEYRDSAVARAKLKNGLSRLANEARTSPIRMQLNWCSDLENLGAESSTRRRELLHVDTIQVSDDGLRMAMKSTAKTIDEHVKGLPDDSREVISDVR